MKLGINSINAIRTLCQGAGVSDTILNMYLEGIKLEDAKGIIRFIEGNKHPSLAYLNTEVGPLILVGKDWVMNNLTDNELAGIMAMRLQK